MGGIETTHATGYLGWNAPETQGIFNMSEALFHHPLFSLAMYRATHTQLRAGKITQQQADTVHEALARPMRKNDKGETCNLIDVMHGKVASMAAADNLGYGIGELMMATFNWGSIITWIEGHLPQILSALEALLSVFILFA